MQKKSAPIHWQFSRVTEWDSLAASWDEVNAESGALPFLESAFLAPLLKEFGSGSEIVAIGRSSDRPVAAALLAPAARGMSSTFQPSQLPLGPWLVARGLDQVEVAQGLLRRLPGLQMGLGLTQVDPLVHARPASSPVVDTLDYIQTAWIDVAGPFQSYWDARGKNLRANLRKQRNKLEADGVAITFETLVSPDDVAGAIADYGRLETAGWKGEMGTSVHPSNAQGRFYAAMMTNFCKLGRARIWRLKFGDKVVAMDLCIEGGGTLVILKTAFDSELRTVSPAFLMRQEAFQQLFDTAQVSRIEFYGRVMEWHTRWSENVRVLYHENVFRWAFVPALRKLLRRGSSEPVADDNGGAAEPAAPAA